MTMYRSIEAICQSSRGRDCDRSPISFYRQRKRVDQCQLIEPVFC